MSAVDRSAAPVFELHLRLSEVAGILDAARGERVYRARMALIASAVALLVTIFKQIHSGWPDRSSAPRAVAPWRAVYRRANDIHERARAARRPLALRKLRLHVAPANDQGALMPAEGRSC